MPTLDEVCETLLKQPNVLEVNITPMWLSHKWLSPDSCIINVKSWSERWQEYFWAGLPFSRLILEFAPIGFLIDCVMSHVHIIEELGPTQEFTDDKSPSP